jgi:hypothetical protein
MSTDDEADDKLLGPKIPKNPQKSLTCKLCDYVTSNLKDFNKHLSTSKHCSRTILNASVKKGTKNPKYECKFCKKEYSARNSCWYHEKQCLDNPSNKPHEAIVSKVIKKLPGANASDTVTISLSDLCKNSGNGENFCLSLQDMVPCMLNYFKKQNEEHQNEQKQVVQELLNQNKELMHTIREMTPRIGNNNVVNTTNNTQFNLNVFLNEECKDAIKLSDFVKSLNITVEDLEFTKNNGIIEGVSSIIVNNLKGMDVHKRPIHCTDVKRETMYIKNDEWEKDDKLEHVRKFIYLTSCYQTRVIQDWMAVHPGWESNEKMQTEYLTLCKELYKNIENDDAAQRKILKGFIKEVQIDKSMMHS